MFRTAYGPRLEGTGYAFTKPSLTKQSFKAECDINNIISRYNKTGMLDHVMKTGGRYGDFCDVEDYHTSVLKVVEAQRMFESLPSTLRSRFANDPGNFLMFVQDPANVDEMVKLGLAVKREVDSGDRPEIVDGVAKGGS